MRLLIHKQQDPKYSMAHSVHLLSVSELQILAQASASSCIWTSEPLSREPKNRPDLQPNISSTNYQPSSGLRRGWTPAGKGGMDWFGTW